jgi:hypothetical protein
MRLEELSYGTHGGGDVTVRLDQHLTVIAGLDAPARHQWLQRVMGALHGTPAGYGTSLLLRDGSGSQVRLRRDPDGATRAVDIESGQELTGGPFEDSRLDWLALLGLDQAAAQAMMIVRAGEDLARTEAAGEELAETRQLLVRVEAEHDEARAVHQAVAVLRQSLASAEERLGRRAVEELETARAALGELPRLEPSAVERGLLLPTQPPTGLEERHRAYLVDAQDRAEAAARLEEAAPEMGPPSVPWLPDLARMDLVELWARAERLQSARTGVADIAETPGGRSDIIARIEAAHAELEKAEIHLERVRLSNRAARRQLAEAREAEQQILVEAGFDSWLGFRLWRADVMVGPEVDEALEAADSELQRAADAWTEMAGAVEVEAALAVREELESYAAYLVRIGSGVTEAACRDVLDKADAAFLAARAALLETCRPFAVEPEHASEEVAALAALAVHARLQRTLEQAEAAEEAALQRAWDAGASTPGTDALWEERARILQELAAAEADMARAASLAERGDDLRHRLSALESPTRPLPTDDPEMALLTRFAVARRVGPRGEPLPLLFDDALVRHREADKRSLLDLLARLGEAVQVVYLTNDPEAAHWALARSRQGGVAFLDLEASPEPPAPIVTCRDCGRSSDCLIKVARADLCSACALARVGVRNRPRPRRHGATRG